jgi:serine/threonine-protein kinase haspin
MVLKHRDLHENNICISRRTSTQCADDLPGSVLFGRSGLEVTLIDYGLSRAKLPNGEIAFSDLEEDLAVFCGEDGKSQFDTYRRCVCSFHF